MANRNKEKGTRFEVEVVAEAERFGLNAKRAWGSDGRSIGQHPEVDVIADTYLIQCKRRKELPQYLKPSQHVDIQVFREDRGSTFALLPLEDLFRLMAAANGKKI